MSGGGEGLEQLRHRFGLGAERRHAGRKMISEAIDGIGLITFNQLKKRNAMSVEIWDGLKEILDG